jgi:hypothetical protein
MRLQQLFSPSLMLTNGVNCHRRCRRDSISTNASKSAESNQRFCRYLFILLRRLSNRLVPLVTSAIGSGGTVEEIKIFWTGAAAICVYQKLHSFQLAKKAEFPRPPHDSYWVELGLDGSEFSAVASR